MKPVMRDVSQGKLLEIFDDSEFLAKKGYDIAKRVDHLSAYFLTESATSLEALYERLLRSAPEEKIKNRLLLIEILNDLHRNGFVEGGKADVMLRDWVRELRRETRCSFPSSRLKKVHAEVFGPECW